MSPNGPIMNKPPVAGVVSTTPKQPTPEQKAVLDIKAPVIPPAPAIKKETLSNQPAPSNPAHHGQVLGPKRHRTTVVDNTNDTAQVYPMHVKCSCGWESRCGSRIYMTHEQNKEHADMVAHNHEGVRAYTESPK